MRTLAAACAALAALLTFGCAGGGSGVPLDPDPELRFFNAAPDSTALDFLLDTDVEANNVAFLGSSADFSSVEPEDYDLIVREDGQTQELWAESFAPEADHHYAIVAVGLESFNDEPLKRLRFAVLEIDRSTPTGNKARLIVVHAFHRPAGLETPSIDFQNPGNNPQFLLSDIDFGTAKTILVDSGAQTFQARRNGTEQVYVESTQTLAAGKVYLVIVTGVQDGVGAMAPQIVYTEIATKD